MITEKEYDQYGIDLQNFTSKHTEINEKFAEVIAFTFVSAYLAGTKNKEIKGNILFEIEKFKELNPHLI